jgi:hypothetical protein
MYDANVGVVCVCRCAAAAEGGGPRIMVVWKSLVSNQQDVCQQAKEQET